MRAIEKQVWLEELAEMRQTVDEEVRAIRHIAGLAESQTVLAETSLTSNGELDDSSFDVESLKLKLQFEDSHCSSGLSDIYLTQSPLISNLTELETCLRFVSKFLDLVDVI